MKTCLWLTLLSLVAVAYGASIAPKMSLQNSALSKEDEASLMMKAGKSLESVGRLLQGDTALTKEEQEEVLEILSNLTTGEGALNEEDAAYFAPVIAKGIVGGIISYGVQKVLEQIG